MSAPTSTAHSSRRLAATRARLPSRGALAALAFGIAAAACVPVAYYAMFNQFSGYDDEGYFLVSLKLVIQGQRLYDDVGTGYGPVYYLLFGPLFDLIGVTNDAGRVVTLVVWGTGCVAFGEVVRRVTDSLGFGLAAFAVAFSVMSVSIREPMNPGPILYLLVALMAIAFARERPSRRSMAVIGGLAAAAALVKLNIGAFAFAAAAFAVVSLARPPRPVYWALCAAVFVGLPLVVLARDLEMVEVRHYALLVIGSGLLLAWAGGRRLPAPVPGWGALPVALASGAAAVAGLSLVLTMIVFESSPAGLYHGIVTLAVGLRNSFRVIVDVDWHPLLAALPLVALVAVRPRGARHIVAAAKLGAGALVVLLVFMTVAFGDTGFLPVEWGIPLAWLAVVDPPPESPGRAAARRFLAALAVLEALYAYPVAGGQKAFAAAFLVPVAVVLISDAFRDLAPYAAAAGPSARRLIPAVPVLLGLLLVLVTATGPLPTNRGEYNSGVALPFQGATRIHLPSEQARRLVFLVDQVEPCSTFVPLVGLNSLYLFSNKQPPVFAPMAISDRRQRQVVDRLSADRRACAVISPRWIAFWGMGRGFDGPIVSFVARDFRPRGRQLGGEYVAVRKRGS